MYILGYPRSGNTWLCYLLAYCLNCEYDDLDEPGIHPRDQYQRNYVKGGLSHTSYQDKVGRILKTHKFGSVSDHNKPVIYLVRDVRDVIVSYYYYLSSGTSAQTVPSEISSDFSEFVRHYTEKWVEHVNQGLKISPDIILRYEDLLKLTHSVLASIFSKFNTAISERRIEKAVDIFSFKRLSKRDPGDENAASFFRKGIAGDWENKLAESDIERILSIAGDSLASLGYLHGCGKTRDQSDQKPSIALGGHQIRRQRSKVKVVHLCTHDTGGAGIAARRLHQSLQKAGVDSQMLVMNKSSADPALKVVPFEYADAVVKCFDASYFESPLWSRQWMHWDSVLSEYPDLYEGIEGFTDCYSNAKLDLIHEIRQADIIHLHWVAGLMDYRLAPKAFAGKPVFWTLHDMNAFTGGCHYSGNCQKYKKGCGACPQLGSAIEEDLSRQISNQKYKVFKKLNLNIVTPSKWLADCAVQSRLLSGHPIEVIPNGFPLDTFKPGIKSEARSKINISNSKKVILFGADSVENTRKGFKYLSEAINKLPQVNKQDLCILTFGKISEDTEVSCNYPVYSLGAVETEEQVADVYNAADAYVIPSLEDNLPNTVAEALACGTPVVGFAAGGIPEMIEHQKTGYLAEPKDIDGLIKGIDWVLSVHKNGIDFTKSCREKALTEYDSAPQAQAYRRLYQQLHQSSVNNVSIKNSIGQDAVAGGMRETQDRSNVTVPKNVTIPVSAPTSNLKQQKTITIGTSLAPRDIDMQVKTVDSWKKLGFQVASLNCAEEIEILKDSFPEVQFIRTHRNAQKLYGKPYIYFDDFLEFFKSGDEQIFGIVNSDVFLFSENGVIPHILREAENSMVYGSRVEIDSLENLDGEFYDRGFDFFFFDRSILSCFPQSDACIGVTWWDYWAPLIPALNRVPIKKWDCPFAFHIKHAVRWDDKQWHAMGNQVSNYIFGKRCESRRSLCQNDPIKLFDTILSNSTRALFAGNPIDSEKKARRSYEMLPRFGISILAFLEKISTKVHHENYTNSASAFIQTGRSNDGQTVARELNQQGERLFK
ncbi:MAG: glycosyltransferase, partial [Deltaproteobacteria bacterium]|nr:glycosyltransferase [Deltaproteobacteria bacterium]